MYHFTGQKCSLHIVFNSLRLLPTAKIVGQLLSNKNEATEKDLQTVIYIATIWLKVEYSMVQSNYIAGGPINLAARHTSYTPSICMHSERSKYTEAVDSIR